MGNPMSRLLSILRSFRTDDRGTMAIELVLVVPILTWVLMSTFVYFDMFRNEANAHRAALTVADMFSREKTALDDAYLDGAHSLLRTITLDDPDPDYRISVYRFDEDDDRYYLVWSRSRGLAPAYTQANFDAFGTQDKLPLLADGDRSILLETRTVYTPPFDTGIFQLTNLFASDPSRVQANLGSATINTFTVIRPRFNLSLCLAVPPPTNELC